MGDITLSEADAQYTWRRFEGFGPHPALYRDVYDAVYVKRHQCYEETGAPFVADCIMQWVDGYPFARTDPDVDAEAARRAFAAKVAPLYERGETLWETELEPQVRAHTEAIGRARPPSASLTKHVEHLRTCIDGIAEVMGRLHWHLAASSRMGWPDAFAEITGRPKTEAGVFTQGLVTSETVMMRTLRRLARRAKADPQLASAVDGLDLDALRGHTGFWRSFQRLLRTDGLRNGAGFGSKSTFTSPTWRMDPTIPLAMIRTYMKSDLDEIDGKERRAKARRVRATKKVRGPLSGEQLERFDVELSFAHKGAHTLEDHNVLMDQTYAGLVREAIDAVGRKLVAMGRIDHPDDAFHLHVDEVTARRDLRPLVAEREAEFERQKDLDMPLVLGREPEGEAFSIIQYGEGLKDGVLHGIPASPGTYTGPARVVLSPADFDRIQDGDVLVTEDTGPDWTPIFAVLGAVVLDKGTDWQHAAVVAREFGIPAVVGTKEATVRLREGRTVRVDGSDGRVREIPPR